MQRDHTHSSSREEVVQRGCTLHTEQRLAHRRCRPAARAWAWTRPILGALQSSGSASEWSHRTSFSQGAYLYGQSTHHSTAIIAGKQERK